MPQIVKSFKTKNEAVLILEKCYDRDKGASWGKMQVYGNILLATATEDKNEHGELVSDNIIVTIQSNYLPPVEIEDLFNI